MGNDNGQAIIPAPTGAVVRQEFGAQELQRSPESASVAVAARARAVIEARSIMAERHPRDWDVVRERFLKECARPGLARQTETGSCAGIWRIKRGASTIEGPSIRLAEIAMRCAGNLAADSTVIYEDADKRIIRVEVIDLEANVGPAREIVVPKTVERRQLAQGQRPISQRMNSYGEMVYLMPATDDQMLERQGALESKTLRVLILRVFPGDILDEGMALIRATQRAEIKADPDAAKRRLLVAFAGVGVDAASLKLYVGHSLDALAPAEHDDLLAVYDTLKAGAATWADLLEAKTGITTAEKPAADAAALAATLKAKREARKAKAKVDAAKDPVPADRPPPADAVREMTDEEKANLAKAEREVGADDA